MASQIDSMNASAQTPRRSPGKSDPRISEVRFAWGVTVLFVAACLVGMLNHAMWRDELYAWCVALASRDLVDLIDNRGHDGHPALWFTMVYLLTKLSDTPFIMQMVHLVIAAVVIYVFARFSPFTRFEKFLFCFGYFPLFEYGIIARNYALGILLVFLFCFAHERRKTTYLPLAAILSLMAQVNVYAAILAVSLAVYLVIDGIRHFAGSTMLSTRVKADVCLSTALFVASMLFVTWHVMPPREFGSAVHWERIINPRALISSLTIVWNSYVPVPDPCTASFWNTNLWHAGYARFGSVVPAIIVAVSVLLVGIASCCFVTRPAVLGAYWSGTVAVWLFTVLVYPGALRHHGHLFILLIACCWLMDYRGTEGTADKHRSAICRRLSHCGRKLFVPMLVVHFGVGIWAYTLGMVYPFSNATSTAHFISKQQSPTTVVVYPYGLGQGLPMVLGRPVYFLPQGSYGNFLRYDRNGSGGASCSEILRLVAGIIDEKHEEVLLVLNRPLGCDAPDLNIVPEARFIGGIVEDEDGFVYRVRRVHARSEVPTHGQVGLP
jgi:hypothetical protein